MHPPLQETKRLRTDPGRFGARPLKALLCAALLLAAGAVQAAKATERSKQKAVAEQTPSGAQPWSIETVPGKSSTAASLQMPSWQAFRRNDPTCGTYSRATVTETTDAWAIIGHGAGTG